MSGGHVNSAMRNEDVRAAILAAAEALLQRGGTDAVTLSGVAREANFARGVIYAHFTSRQELLDGLGVLADQPPRADAVLPEVAAPAPMPVASAPEQDGASYDALMRAQAEVLTELSRQAIVGGGRPRDATETALSRFEARLSVTEKSLAALELRVGEGFKTCTVDTTALGEKLQGVRQRLEKFEARQMEALAELRLEVYTSRQSSKPVLSLVPPATVVAFCEAAEDAQLDAASSTEEAPIPEPQTAENPDADETTTAQSKPGDYLISARRSAIEAAERVARQPVRRPTTWRKRRWAIIAVAATLVIWFDIYVFAHYQPAQGAADIPPQAAVVHVAKAQPKWSPQAQLVRGLKYLNGTGVPVDVVKARGLIEGAALGGQPVAENLMGVLYQTGTGVAVDMPVAIGWYEGAAAHGNLKAMTNLGKLYAGGWPEGIDYMKAAAWFAKAAAFGERDAQFDLAILYERGEGVPQNMAMAYKWYAIAGANGDSHAATRASILASQLSDSERLAAEAEIADFQAQPVDHAANEIPAANG